MYYKVTKKILQITILSIFILYKVAWFGLVTRASKIQQSEAENLFSTFCQYVVVCESKMLETPIEPEMSNLSQFFLQNMHAIYMLAQLHLDVNPRAVRDVIFETCTGCSSFQESFLKRGAFLLRRGAGNVFSLFEPRLPILTIEVHIFPFLGVTLMFLTPP